MVAIRAHPAEWAADSSDLGFTPVLPGGHFMDSNTTLFSMIVLAYDITNPGSTTGRASGLGTQSFVLGRGKAGSGFCRTYAAENRDQVRLMLRAMLADRFPLASAHRDAGVSGRDARPRKGRHQNQGGRAADVFGEGRSGWRRDEATGAAV
ncbi:MAG: hypothetical protein WDO73_16595 [Ignavibacteriota bacterium]